MAIFQSEISFDKIPYEIELLNRMFFTIRKNDVPT